MKKNIVKSQRQFEPFVFIATVIVFVGGLMALISKFLSGKEDYHGFNIYYLALIFSVVLLFKALTEKGFNPGNYLFYCIVVLFTGIFLENNIKKLLYNNRPMAMISVFFLVGVLLIGAISNWFYIYTMNKGLKSLEEKENKNRK